MQQEKVLYLQKHDQMQRWGCMGNVFQRWSSPASMIVKSLSTGDNISFVRVTPHHEDHCCVIKK